MRLVYLVNSLGIGGAERHLLNLTCDMVSRGYSVWVVVLRREVRGGASSLDHEFSSAGAEVVFLRDFGLADFGLWLSLISLLKRLRPNILHSHLPRADLAASIAKVVLPTMHWVSTIHDTYTKDKYSGYWIFPLVGWNWRRADQLVAVSRRVQAWSVCEFSMPPNKTRVIYHGVPVYEVFDFLPAKSKTFPIIGCLARFEKRKGLETLIKAMSEVVREFPSAQLLLAGSDPAGYSSVIKHLIKALNLEGNVKVLGFCSTPLEFLHDLDVFAFASTSEGFGIVLIEAMSVKRSIVASDIYPINHIVQHGKSGLLVCPGDHQAFASAISELLRKPQMRHEMGESGYWRCIEEFSLEQALNRVHDLYLELTSATCLRGG